MPVASTREIAAAGRLDNVRYAIRDLACVADEVIQQGHKVLPLNIGDPLVFDFQTPAPMIEAVYKAIRGDAERKGITSIQDVFVTSGVSETVDICLAALLNPGENLLTPSPDYPL